MHLTPAAARLRAAAALIGVMTVLVASFAIGGCGDPAPQTVIVRVGQAAITKSALDHWISVLAPRQATPVPPQFQACIAHLKELALYPTAQAQLKSACQHEYEELRHTALQQLIADQWLIGEAADQGTPVSAHEVSHQINTKYGARENQAEYKESLALGGHTSADIALEVRTELAALAIRKRLLAYSLAFPHAQVASYYRRNTRRFFLPERREVELLDVQQAATANKLAREVRAKGDFASRSFHESLERPDFNKIGLEKRVFDRIVFAASPGVLVGPLHVDGYYFLFEVTKVAPARTRSLAEATSAIMKELSTKRRVHFVLAWREKWAARTTCAPGYVVQKCREYRGVPIEEDPLDVN